MIRDITTREPRAPSQQLETWLAEFRQVRPTYQRFTSKLDDLLRDLLRVESIEHHLLEHRTKTEESLREKLARSSKSYTNPLVQITDISGLRIITYYQDDADRIGRLIESEFCVDAQNSISHAPGPSEFGYKSAHYVVSLGSARSDLLEWKGLAGLKAEIQVRTVLQHAWAAISHKLQYKREEDVPIPLRRKLFRLSALFELSDDEFISLRNAAGSIAHEIGARITSGDKKIAIDHLSTSQFLIQSPIASGFASEAKKIGFHVKRQDSDSEKGSVSDLVTLSGIVGIETLEELETVLAGANEWSKGYLKAQFLAGDGLRTRWEVTPAFLSQLIVIGKYPNTISINDLTDLGWDDSIAERVINTAISFPKTVAHGRTAG